MSPTGPKNTRVSAILFVRKLTPWAPELAEMAILHNPYAEFPLAQSTLPVRSSSSSSTMMTSSRWAGLTRPSMSMAHRGSDGRLRGGILITGLMRAIEERSGDDPMSGPELMTKDEVKLAVKTVLEQKGYSVEVAWGHTRGVDLEARKDDERLLIEAKGDAPTPQMQGNYFLSALGELVQRMVDPDAEYVLALPDAPRYRGLVERLPDHALDVLRLHAFLVGVRTTTIPLGLRKRACRVGHACRDNVTRCGMRVSLR